MGNILLVTPIKHVYEHLSKLLKRSKNVISLADILKSDLNELTDPSELDNAIRERFKVHNVKTVIYIPNSKSISDQWKSVLRIAASLHKEISLFEINIQNFIYVQGTSFTQIRNLDRSTINLTKIYEAKSMKIENILIADTHDPKEKNLNSKDCEVKNTSKKYKVSLVDDIANLLLTSKKNTQVLSTECYTEKELISAMTKLSQQNGLIADNHNDPTHLSKIKILLRQKNCALKPIYELKPSHIWRGSRVEQLRYQLGRDLAACIPPETTEQLDVIIPVPETGKCYARAISSALSLPYVEAIDRNKSMGRGLQLDDTDARNIFIRKKLQLKSELVRGKNVGVVDEAIFTGSTLKIIVEKLKDAQVKNIYILIPTPPNILSCMYNVQPERAILLDYIRQDQLAQYFDVNGIIMSKLSILKNNLSSSEPLCHSCFGE